MGDFITPNFKKELINGAAFAFKVVHRSGSAAQWRVRLNEAYIPQDAMQ